MSQERKYGSQITMAPNSLAESIGRNLSYVRVAIHAQLRSPGIPPGRGLNTDRGAMSASRNQRFHPEDLRTGGGSVTPPASDVVLPSKAGTVSG